MLCPTSSSLSMSSSLPSSSAKIFKSRDYYWSLQQLDKLYFTPSSLAMTAPQFHKVFEAVWVGVIPPTESPSWCKRRWASWSSREPT
jgi:hypothetical protein